MKRGQPNRSLVLALGVAAVVGGASIVVAQQAGRLAKRARPPEWSAEVRDVFFDDAREQLVGARPDYGNVAPLARQDGRPAPSATADSADSTGALWPKLIHPDTLETEIKRLAEAVANDVTTPTAFKGGTYQDCRRHFSVLAMLFAVAAEYDGQVRWQDTAPTLRDVFARTGHNCKVGTDQTYRESLERRQDLADLIRGSRPQRSSAEHAADWSEVADRPPLMQRLGMAHDERLTKWLASERQFARHREEVRHEAQLAATIADVIAREGFEYWDDEQYAQYARELREAAIEIAAAAEFENYDRARQAVTRATHACTNCHEGYRG